MKSLGRVLAVGLIASVVFPGGAAARPSIKKAIWGPVDQFATYADLGVGIYEHTLAWRAIAPSRPSKPRDPADPAYHWSSELDTAISAARRRGMRVSVLLTTAPSWANGGHPPHWAPKRPRDFADFAVAASRRYPGVAYWMIWGEPSKISRFQPLIPA